MKMSKKVCNDCSYNCVKQLAKKLEVLWRIDGYIKDAKKLKHKECAKVFEVIKKDTIKHADLLKDLIEKKAKSKKFK